MMDAEGTTDGFIKCFFNTKNAKETDTNYRNQNGKCSFNYRLLFKFDHPAKSNEDYKLKIQAYDRDFFKSNDLIGEYVLDLKPIIQDSEIAVRPMAVAKDYYDEYLKQQQTLPDGSKVTYWDNDIEFHAVFQRLSEEEIPDLQPGGGLYSKYVTLHKNCLTKRIISRSN